MMILDEFRKWRQKMELGVERLRSRATDGVFKVVLYSLTAVYIASIVTIVGVVLYTFISDEDLLNSGQHESHIASEMDEMGKEVDRWPTPRPTVLVLGQQHIEVQVGPTKSAEIMQAEQRVTEILEALEVGDSAAFYSFLSEEVADATTEDWLMQAMAEAGDWRWSVVGDAVLQGTDWIEQEVLVETGLGGLGEESDVIQRYSVILRRENDQWKLFGTMPLPDK